MLARSDTYDRETVTFDALSAHWQAAFALAADALLAATGCRSSLGFGAQELDERRGRLARERETTARLLKLIAREEHVV